MNQAAVDVQILNNILNKLGVTGFKFTVFDDKILFLVKRNYLILEATALSKFDDWIPVSWQQWNNINEMITDGKVTFDILLDHINVAKQTNSNSCYAGDLLSINDAGIAFIKYIQEVSSLEELELKLAISGY